MCSKSSFLNKNAMWTPDSRDVPDVSKCHLLYFTHLIRYRAKKYLKLVIILQSKTH